MTIQRKHTFAIIIIASITLPIIAASVALNPAGTDTPYENDIAMTPASFNPIVVDSVDFKLYNENRVPIYDTRTRGDEPFHYSDPDHVYPGVDILWSQPYLSTPQGAFIDDPAGVTSTPVARLITPDGSLYFYHEYHLSMCVYGRTFENMKDALPAPVPLSPINQATFSAQGAYVTYTGKVATNPGVIVATINCGPNTLPVNGYWPAVNQGTTRAEITSLLEPMEFQISNHNPPPAPGKDLNSAITAMKTRWGNSMVTIEPTVSLKGLSDFFQFSYYKNVTLENGTWARVLVQTTSGKVGFLASYRDLQFEEKGLVPNVAPVNVSGQLYMPNDGFSAEETRAGELDNEPVASHTLPVQTLTATGWVQYMSSRTEQVTLKADPHSHTNTLGGQTLHVDTGNLAQFTLPQQLNHTIGMDLRPLTTISIASTEVKYQAVFYDIGAQHGVDGVTVAGSKIIEYPHAIKIDNVYVGTRFTFKVGIVTENAAQVVNVGGKPIDPADITDFGLNYVGLDPSADDMWDAIAAHPIDSGVILQTIITWIIVIVAIVIGASILGIVVYFKVLFGGRNPLMFKHGGKEE